MGLLLITRFTLQEIVRRWIFLAIVLITLLLLGVFALLLNAVVDSSLKNSSESADLVLYSGGVLMSLLATWSVYLQSSVITILLTANMISGEVEAGTFSIIVPKPLHRFEIVLGKWLAYALLMGVYTAFLFFAFLGVIYWKTTYWPDQAWGALGMLELGMVALLGLMALGSALLPTLVNGAIAIVLFMGAPFIGFVQLIQTSPSVTVDNVNAVMNLIIPTNVLWHTAASFLIPPTVLNILRSQGAVDAVPSLFVGQPVTLPLFIWALGYCIALPLLAVWRFQRRNL